MSNVDDFGFKDHHEYERRFRYYGFSPQIHPCHTVEVEIYSVHSRHILHLSGRGSAGRCSHVIGPGHPALAGFLRKPDVGPLGHCSERAGRGRGPGHFRSSTPSFPYPPRHISSPSLRLQEPDEPELFGAQARSSCRISISSKCHNPMGHSLSRG